MRKLLSVIGAMLLLSSAILAATATSISQYGITWTFDKAYEVGQFCTGDWWVLGPVTVGSVVPAPAAGRNGSMVNPLGGSQAYDSRGAQYSAGAAATFPVVIQPTSSLVSSISKSGSGAGPDFLNVGVLQTQAVLTVVNAVPVAGCFRPAYAGTYKTTSDTNQIKWTNLPKVAATAMLPTGSVVMGPFERPRIDHVTNSGIQYSCAQDNWWGCYGREVSNQVSEAALYVMLDKPERKQLTICLIQLGIDNYGVLKAGGGWPKGQNNPGGHFSGRKFPIVFAGLMLDDAVLKNFDRDFTDELLFQEDLQVYRGTEGKALWGSPCISCYMDNGCAYGGSCTAGAKDCRDPAGLIDGCGDYRYCCTSKTWVGQALAVRMMQAMDIWNNDVYFDYVDRWVAEEGPSGGISDVYGSTFVALMWKRYRNVSIQQTQTMQGATRALPVQVLPNPMRDRTMFTLPERSGDMARVEIFGRNGQAVNTIVATGRSLMQWDGTDLIGQPVVPGVYFYTVTMDGRQEPGRIVVLPKN